MTLRLRLATSPRYLPVPACAYARGASSVTPRSVDRADGPFLGLRARADAGHFPVSGTALPVRRRDDHPVAGPPAGDRLGEEHAGRGFGAVRAELDPGPGHLGAVKVHPAATTDDRRAIVGVEPANQSQANERLVIAGDRVLGCADLQHRPLRFRHRPDVVRLAVESRFTRDRHRPGS